MKLALLRTEIMEDVLRHLKKYDNPTKREEKNYITQIEKETGWSHTSVVKCVKILQQLNLVKKVSNGQTNTIKLKVDWKS